MFHCKTMYVGLHLSLAAHLLRKIVNQFKYLQSIPSQFISTLYFVLPYYENQKVPFLGIIFLLLYSIFTKTIFLILWYPLNHLNI